MPSYPLDDAIDYVLHWEDEALTGEVTTDRGGKTRFGLSQRANPDLTDENFYALGKDAALAKARQVYAERYGAHVLATEIADDCVRAKVLDMHVSMGYEGVMLVQRAVGVPEDGAFGPNTLRAVNTCSANGLVQKLANLSLAHYTQLEGSNDEHKSWARRGACLGKLGVNTPRSI